MLKLFVRRYRNVNHVGIYPNGTVGGIAKYLDAKLLLPFLIP